jgi:hypothetical protein
MVLPRCVSREPAPRPRQPTSCSPPLSHNPPRSADDDEEDDDDDDEEDDDDDEEDDDDDEEDDDDDDEEDDDDDEEDDDEDDDDDDDDDEEDDDDDKEDDDEEPEDRGEEEKDAKVPPLLRTPPPSVPASLRLHTHRSLAHARPLPDTRVLALRRIPPCLRPSALTSAWSTRPWTSSLARSPP